MKPTEAKRTKIPRIACAKAPGLLPMLYKVSELADELGLPESTLRSWLRIGAPCIRNANGHIWINGEEFANWIVAQYQQKQPTRLNADEVYS